MFVWDEIISDIQVLYSLIWIFTKRRNKYLKTFRTDMTVIKYQPLYSIVFFNHECYISYTMISEFITSKI